MWKPRIVHAPGFDEYATGSSPHEAGYDAYLAGFCFIRSLHLAATVSYLDIKRMRVLAFHELLKAWVNIFHKSLFCKFWEERIHIF